MAWRATHSNLLSRLGSFKFWGSGLNSQYSPIVSISRMLELSRASAQENITTTPWDFGSQFKYFHSSAIVSKSTGRAFGTGLITSDFKDLEDLLGRRVRWNSSDNAPLHTKTLQNLFAGYTTSELMFMLMNLQLVAFEPVVDLGSKVLTSRLMRWQLAADPIYWLLKKTAYAHFCAGEDVDEAKATLGRLWNLGLKGALDYGSEDAIDEESCDKNLEGFLQTINLARSMPENSVSFVCVKVSALCPVDLLKHMSDHLRWQHKDPGYKIPWKHDGLPIFAPQSPTYHTPQSPIPLTVEEEGNYFKAERRLRKICELASERNVPLLLDAEYLSIQPAIDYLAYASAEEFNSDGRPIVYTTMQAYLRDTPSKLSLVLDEAARRKAFLAFKIVRGAYMYREKEEAALLGVENPINPNIEATHLHFNSCNLMALHRVAAGTCALTCATHNMHSGRLIAQKVDELGLSRADPRLQFAQLKGMADSLSLALVQAGFVVSKWLTFGDVEKTIPFLMRRAQENRGLLGNNLADRQRLWSELLCRFQSSLGLRQHM